MGRKKQYEAEAVKNVDAYLQGYITNRRLVELDRYEKKFFEEEEIGTEREIQIDLPMARAKMFEIKHFVLGLANSEEKLLLYYHYIRGRSMEDCAELLGVSRSTAYRIKDRALVMAGDALLFLLKRKSNQKENVGKEY